MKRLLAVAAVLAVAVTAAAAPDVPAHTGGAYWPFTKVIRVLDDTKVRIGRRTLRIEGAVTACTGQGRARTRRGSPAWNHFRCIRSTLSPRGRDLAFVVHVHGTRRFTISNAQFN